MPFDVPSPLESSSLSVSPLAAAGPPPSGGRRQRERWELTDPLPQTNPLPNSPLGRVVSAIGYLVIAAALIILLVAISNAGLLLVAGSLFISGLGLLATGEVLHRLIDISASLRKITERQARDLDPDRK